MEYREQVRTAHRLLKMRSLRWDYFSGDLFDEHGWNLLLILFVANGEDRVITASQASKESGATAVVAQRWFKHLELQGLVTAEDGAGVALTALTRAEMAQYLLEAATLLDRTNDAASGADETQDR